MTQNVIIRGRKTTDATEKAIAVTTDGYVKVDGSISVDTTGLATSANQTAGTKIIDSAGTNKLAIDANGKIGINTLAVTTDAATNIGALTTPATGSVNAQLASLVTKMTTPSTITDGRQTVTTAGTRVQLISGSTPCTQVIVTALLANTNAVTVGGVTVVGAASTRAGIPLFVNSGAPDSVTLNIDNVNKVYIDSVTNGEGVSFTYLT
jgi:hypothetical protein